MAARGQVLLSREAETGAIAAALGRAREGAGGLVILEGAAGVGKSALLESALAQARDGGTRVLSARSAELERDNPFGVIHQLYAPALDTTPPTERAELLAGAVAPAAGLLSADAGSDGSHAAGFATMHALYWLTCELADSPLVIAVDDAHWADRSSLRALEYLARRLSELPVLLVIALRSDEPGARAELLDALRVVADTRLVLGPLDAEAVARLVRAQLPGLDDATAVAFGSATGGNPLYVQELLRTLGSRADLNADDVTAASIRILGDRVLRRVERVDVQAAALVAGLAILDSGARLRVAAELVGIPEPRAASIAHQLRRLEILTREDPVVFTHPLIRRSVYDAISERDRGIAHRRAADLLLAAGAPIESVAAHLREVPPGSDAALAQILADAADAAVAHGGTDEALVWLERAVGETVPSGVRADLLARLGAAQAAAHDPAAITSFTEALTQAEGPALRTRISVQLAELLGFSGDWSAAVAIATSAEQELADVDAELRAEVAAIRAVITLFDPAGINDFDRRRPLYEQLAGEDHWASYALAALLGVEAANRGRVTAALEWSKRAVDGGRCSVSAALERGRRPRPSRRSSSPTTCMGPRRCGRPWRSPHGRRARSSDCSRRWPIAAGSTPGTEI
jgi:hypothetical protein